MKGAHSPSNIPKSSSPSSTSPLKFRITKSRKSHYQSSTTIHANTDYDKLFNKLFPNKSPRSTKHQQTKQSPNSRNHQNTYSNNSKIMAGGAKTGRNSVYSCHASPKYSHTPKSYSMWKPVEDSDTNQHNKSRGKNSGNKTPKHSKNGRTIRRSKQHTSKAHQQEEADLHPSTSNIHGHKSKLSKGTRKKYTQYSNYDFTEAQDSQTDSITQPLDYSRHQPEQLRLKNLSQLCILKLKQLDRRSQELSAQNKIRGVGSGCASPKNQQQKSSSSRLKDSKLGSGRKVSKSKNNKIFVSSINNKGASHQNALIPEGGLLPKQGYGQFISEKSIQKLRESYTKIFKNAMGASLKNVVTQPMKKKVKDSEYFKFS